MSSTVRENHAQRRLVAGELVLCMGVNQMPGRADVKRLSAAALS
jgi:hypothetical protein